MPATEKRKINPKFWLPGISLVTTATIVAGAIFVPKIDSFLVKRSLRNEAIKESRLEGKTVDDYLTQGVPWHYIKYFTEAGIGVEEFRLLKTDPDLTRMVNEATYPDQTRSIEQLATDTGWDITNSIYPWKNRFNWEEYRSWRAKDAGIYNMAAAKHYGLSLDDFSRIPYKPTTEHFNLLEKYGIEKEYALPLMQKGMKVEEIAEKYSRERTGVSADVRLRYRKIAQVIHGKVSDEEIKELDQSGMKPSYFAEMANHGVEYKAFPLIRKGKLNGDIYVKWREAGIGPKDIIPALVYEYSLPEVQKMMAMGKSVEQFHSDSAYTMFILDIAKQRDASQK